MTDIADDEDFTDVYAKYIDICNALNIDQETQERSWNEYEKLMKRFTLEGESVQWLCCALYIGCQETRLPTVGDPLSVISGNCIQLNHLLRNCNMSINEFLTKIKHWAEISNLSNDFLMKINYIERKYCITLLIFDRYKNLFEMLFVVPPSEEDWQNRRIQGKLCCSRLYDICWLLFLNVKCELQRFALELVDSYHLLICCLDLVYRNVLTVKRLELLKKEFEGVPPHNLVNDFYNYCTIDAICKQTEAIPIEAKKLKRGHFSLVIIDFFEAKILHGQALSMLGLFDKDNLNLNMKSLRNNYEQYLLSECDFDERVMPNYVLKSTEVTPVTGLVRNTESLHCRSPNTPYTRQHLLNSKKDQHFEATAADDMKQLQALSKITSLEEFIQNRLDLNDIKRNNELLEEMSLHFDEVDGTNSSDFQLAKSVYYFLLTKIIRAELRLKPSFVISKFLSQHIFNKALISCSVELVLVARRSELTFPWILHCFKITAYDFSKIIEIIVLRHDGLLTRRLIKHLNRIEELCLELLVWRETSPIWNYTNDIVGHTAMTIQKELVLNSILNENALTAANESIPQHTKRLASVKIVLRKVYNLARLRLFKLCTGLKLIPNTDIQAVIWCIFQHSINHHAHALLRNRHLDQILMCAVYIYLRMDNVHDLRFVDIISCYRQQPQAKRSVYRRVLMSHEQDYDDLIRFYNKIYLPQMATFAMQLKSKSYDKHLKGIEQDTAALPQATPKRVSLEHDLYITHMDHNMRREDTVPMTLMYEFAKRDTINLERMNAKVRGCKRVHDEHDVYRHGKRRPNILKRKRHERLSC